MGKRQHPVPTLFPHQSLSNAPAYHFSVCNRHITELPRGAACSNLNTQPCGKTFEDPGGGGGWVPQHTYLVLIIWNLHKWGKNLFHKKFVHQLSSHQPRSTRRSRQGSNLCVVFSTHF